MRVLISLVAVFILNGCGAEPVRHSAAPHATAIRVAEALVGKPYRYGGSSPEKGFDCSGLVWYAYREAGRSVPRTTGAQFNAIRPVNVGSIRSGDVLFFRIDGKASHVGLYVGDGRFIHAPSSGKRVSYGSLANPYWQARLVKAGRFR